MLQHPHDAGALMVGQTEASICCQRHIATTHVNGCAENVGVRIEEYIGGQISCGFAITGYVEQQMDDITELYFMTKAEKK